MVICLEWVQTCIWPSWCHCHSLSLASVKSTLVLPFWYRLTWVVLDKGPLNGCVCVCVAVLSGCISSALEEHGETCWPWAGFLPTGHRSTTAKLTTGQTDTRLVLYAFCYRHGQNNNSMIVVADYRLWVCQAGEGSHVDAVWHSRVPCTRNYSQQSK